MSELFSILQILLKYEPNGNVYAEHDTIWLSGPNPETIDNEDLKKLEALSCYYDQSYDSWRFSHEV
jgi:hypothetical protein